MVRKTSMVLCIYANHACCCPKSHFARCAVVLSPMPGEALPAVKELFVSCMPSNRPAKHPGCPAMLWTIKPHRVCEIFRAFASLLCCSSMGSLQTTRTSMGDVDYIQGAKPCGLAPGAAARHDFHATCFHDVLRLRPAHAMAQHSAELAPCCTCGSSAM